MPVDFSPRKFNLTAWAQSGLLASGHTDVLELPRLRADLDLSGPPPPPIQWQAQVQQREQAGVQEQLWLHLRAQAQLPLGCQRCLKPAEQALEVDRWFRFVESEEVAQAEDDDSEEDLLVFEPQFDLLELLEDELLMDLPLVPMHETCPQPPTLASDDSAEPADDKPHPFAALAQLKKTSG
ncbi:MAG: DUF177 domain-containing protein [Betaproteobacteria bacterium]